MDAARGAGAGCSGVSDVWERVNADRDAEVVGRAPACWCNDRLLRISPARVACGCIRLERPPRPGVHVAGGANRAGAEVGATVGGAALTLAQRWGEWNEVAGEGLSAGKLRATVLPATWQLPS